MIRKSGKYYIDTEHNVSLGIDSSNLKNCISEYNKQYKLFRKGIKYDSIFGHYSFGFKENNLDFLKYFEKVKKIWFWDVNLNNIEGLYYLKNLESIGILGNRPSIDFSKFSKLKEITIDWEAKDFNLEKCEMLNNFYLWHHKPKNKNFDDFKFPLICKNNVSLNWTNVEDLTSLNGIQGMKNFEIHRSRNLKSLNGLEKYSDTLESIITTTCEKLTDYKFVKDFPKLKKVIINGNSII